MKILKAIIILVLSGSLLLAKTQTDEDPNLDLVISSAKSATKTLLDTLQQQMQEHMAKGGVMDALDFCSNEAYVLMDKVNSQLAKSISVKRISTKYRNPANKPQNDEIKVLKELESKKELPPFIVEKIDEHTYKFYKPITINKPVCLKCHGDISTNKELQTAISSKYPDDKAVNYKLDNLRGAVVVTIKR